LIIDSRNDDMDVPHGCETGLQSLKDVRLASVYMHSV